MSNNWMLLMMMMMMTEWIVVGGIWNNRVRNWTNNQSSLLRLRYLCLGTETNKKLHNDFPIPNPFASPSPCRCTSRCISNLMQSANADPHVCLLRSTTEVESIIHLFCNFDGHSLSIVPAMTQLKSSNSISRRRRTTTINHRETIVYYSERSLQNKKQDKVALMALTFRAFRTKIHSFV